VYSEDEDEEQIDDETARKSIIAALSVKRPGFILRRLGLETDSDSPTRRMVDDSASDLSSTSLDDATVHVG
jgi:hypothetical protein